MHSVGMNAIGSAGFSTIMRARQLGAPTVIRAMVAYAEHHGVQHFGVAALTERLEMAGFAPPGTTQGEGDRDPLSPQAELCSALLLASAHHPARQADVVSTACVPP
jgi:hypothetical protein